MKLWSKIKLLCMIGLIYYAITYFTGCPIKYITGISCPGCGMTRAWLALLHLDIRQAFHYHPLFWCAPLFLFYILFEDRIDHTKIRWALLPLLVLFLAVYFVRLLYFPNEIVNFDPAKGLLVQNLSRVFSHFS